MNWNISSGKLDLRWNEFGDYIDLLGVLNLKDIWLCTTSWTPLVATCRIIGIFYFSKINYLYMIVYINSLTPSLSSLKIIYDIDFFLKSSFKQLIPCIIHYQNIWLFTLEQNWCSRIISWIIDLKYVAFMARYRLFKVFLSIINPND